MCEWLSKLTREDFYISPHVLHVKGSLSGDIHASELRENLSMFSENGLFRTLREAVGKLR
jgi:hypothetical protein